MKTFKYNVMIRQQNFELLNKITVLLHEMENCRFIINQCIILNFIKHFVKDVIIMLFTKVK